MPVYNSAELLKKLHNDVEYIISQHKNLSEMPDRELLLQPTPNKWSIAQVLEHLNGYNRFYLPVMERGIELVGKSQAKSFRAGLLGDYFTKIMEVKPDGSLRKKMNSPKKYNYPPDLDIGTVMREFAEGQEKLLVLLSLAVDLDLNKVKIPISISRFIKLKLGDGLRFLIAHQLRHFIQIENVKKELSL